MVDSSWWKRLSTLERALIVIALSVVLLCSAIAIGVGMIISHPILCDTGTDESFHIDSLEFAKTSSQMCNTSTCIHTASVIHQNMDKSVNPCDDFYKFVCGNYIKETSIPDDKSFVNAFTQVQDEVQVKLRKSIEEPIKFSDPQFIRLVKNLYKSCLNEKSIEEQGVQPLLAMLNELGGWPVLEGDDWNKTNFHWMESVFKFRDIGLPINFFIGFDIKVDLKDTSKRTISIDQPSLGLVHEFFVGKQGEKIVEAYYDYMVEVAVLLGAEEKVAKKELIKSLEFELELARISISTERHRSIARLYHPMTVKKLSTRYPSISWKKYFNRLLAPKTSANDYEKVVVQVPVYLRNFPDVINMTSRRVQANYVMWRAIATTITYLNEDMRNSQQKFEMKKSGQPARGLRWKECIKLIRDRLPLSVGSLYIKKYFKEKARKEVVEMFRAIQYELSEVLQKVDWMDSYTRKNALRKTSAMASHIAYPNELLDEKKLDEIYQNLELTDASYFNNALNLSRFEMEYSIDKLRKPFNKSEWTNHGDAAVVNAFYSLIENSIRIPAAILQGSIFDKKRPKYMNYGAIGFVIGHEMTHGFDDTGRFFDQNGKIVYWWTLAAAEKYSRQVKCIIQQYKNYVVPEVGINLNGLTTRNENIADNGGIKLAYLAYQRWASKHMNEESLPGLYYTPQQMFWISVANPWCSKYRPEHLRLMIVEDPHSPAEFRIRGSISNMVEFANDFKCSKKAKMNPSEKCLIW